MSPTKMLLLALGVYLLWPRPKTAVKDGSPYQRGVASWYGPRYYGNQTANGEIFTAREMTAAHKTLPFNTRVEVTDENTGKSVVVRINDRGPHVAGRIIDLSEKAAEELGIKKRGIAPVRLDIV